MQRRERTSQMLQRRQPKPWRSSVCSSWSVSCGHMNVFSIAIGRARKADDCLTFARRRWRHWQYDFRCDAPPRVDLLPRDDHQERPGAAILACVRDRDGCRCIALGDVSGQLDNLQLRIIGHRNDQAGRCDVMKLLIYRGIAPEPRPALF